MEVDNEKKQTSIELPLDKVSIDIKDEKDTKEQIENPKKDVEDNNENLDKSKEEDKNENSNENLDKSKEVGNEDESSIIEIDGEQLTLDKDGNALNDKGEIVYTSEDISKMEDDSEEESSSLKLIAKASGIQILDDNNQPIEFEETVEGYAKREAAIKALGEKEGFNKGFQSFLNENPDIAEIVEYKQRFGTIEGYSSNVDYSKIQLSDDESQLVDLVYKAEIQKGTSPERAKKIVEFEKSNNSLKEAATESLEFLKNKQDQEVQARVAREQSLYEEELKKEIGFYGVSYEADGVKVHNVENSLYDCIINKGRLGDMIIPKEGLKVTTHDKKLKTLSRQDLFDYIAKPVQEIDGSIYTMAQLDEIKRLSNPAEFALRAISNLTGGLEQLVKASVAEEQVKVIKKLSSKKTTSINKQSNNNKTGGTKLNLPLS